MSTEKSFVRHGERENTARLPIPPICRIKHQCNEILVRAAKKRKSKRKFKKSKRKEAVKREELRHWNTNLVYGRVTRSWGKLLRNAQFIIRLRYVCMPLLGDEHLLEPSWEVHTMNIAVEYANT